MKNENDIYMMNFAAEIDRSFDEVSKSQKKYMGQMTQDAIKSMEKDIRSRATQPLKGATITLQNNRNQTESFTITKAGYTDNG